MAKFKFEHVVAAGTWDHFHAGQRQFLDKAFEVGKRVAVGVTQPKLTTGKTWPETIESMETRRQSVVEFVRQNGWENRSAVVPLKDIYGPTLTNTSFDGLVVTDKTWAGGQKVNWKRQEKGLPPLQLIKVKLKKASDGKEIASERIRAGEINREGVVYLRPFEKATEFKLPQDLRQEFHQPFGELIPGRPNLKKKLLEIKPVRVIVVGDVSAQLLIAQGIKTDIFIVDLMVERKKKFASIADMGLPKGRIYKVANRAGTVSGELARAIQAEPQIIQVEGEEDLAVLPAVLVAPLQSVVIYGQPGEGVVVVEVTEIRKQVAYQLLKKLIRV